MCGINGFNWQDTELAKAMNRAIKHRGPDDEGTYSDEAVSFGHVRLSIIDLSERGHQPMGVDSKNSQIFRDGQLKDSEITIVFNGEIYNFQEVKKEIEKEDEQTKGKNKKNIGQNKFQSDSDTEVILRAYKKWGTSCVKKFNGMWAFCIHDKRKNILFCSRDRLGVKPFYYYYGKEEKEKNFVFSSELKGILEAKKINKKENINREAVELYFSLGYIPSPLSIYNNVYKLEAGHNLLFDLEKKTLKKEKYYELKKYSPLYDRKKLIEEGRKILFDATRLRMISDVPVGAFLSGGLDSSSVVGAMSKNTKLENLHTFSIGFEKKYDKGRYDETEYINLVKDYFKTRHHHYYFKRKDFEKITEHYSFSYDEPFGDYSGYPLYKISELTRKHVTVALSGDGGDEIFGGYAMHKLGAGMDLLHKTPKILRKIASKIPFKKNLNGTQSLYLLKEAMKLSLKSKDKFYSESITEDAYKPASYRKWTEQKLSYSLKKGGNSLAEAMRIHDLLFNTLQDNFLVKVDRSSMQAPIEVRSPFLDYRFVEMAQKIPTEWKTTPGKTKILMREMIKGIVPDEIINRGKQGFEPPLDKWILDKKYEKTLKQGLQTIKSLNSELAEFYENRVFTENNRLYTVYKIKLFIFQNWWATWVN